MENTRFADIFIPFKIYYKFIYCLFIKSTSDATNFETEFNNFCEKYKIIKREEIQTLIKNIKQDEYIYIKYPVDDPYVIGNAILFIIYYLKSNATLFSYLNNMFLLMKATCNAKFKIAGMALSDDDNGEDLIEKTIDNFERIDAMINLTNDMQKITQKINATDIYEIETNITMSANVHIILSITTNP